MKNSRQSAGNPSNLSRRGLLKRGAAASAAAFACPAFLPSARAASTQANTALRLALVGCGGQGRGVMQGLLRAGANLVALCDPDPEQIEKARAEAKQAGGEATQSAKAYDDYRRLLDQESSFDGVLIGTPDHWHFPLCRAFIKAGKHVYCEKPLTHDVAEARELRELAAANPKIITQMGNQGSASASARRCIEVIKAGALGEVKEIYYWGIGVHANEGVPQGEDPIPAGFNWDQWIGPSPMRPFKKGTYHPFAWRGWFDFGNGGLADFCCHAMNMPMRALDLTYPERIVLNRENGKQIPGKAILEFRFPARGKLAPVVFHWQGDGRPDARVLQPLVEVYKDKPPDGVMVIGERGCIHTSHWNTNGLIKLEGDARLTDVTRHAGTKDIPQSLPRQGDHGAEWLRACRGEGKTFSPFQVGGLLTEIGLSGVVALRTGKSLDWDGEKMLATNAPEASRFVKREYRAKWLA